MSRIKILFVSTTPHPATLDFQQLDDGVLKVRLAGDWLLAGTLPSARGALDRIRREPPGSVEFDTVDLGRWDTALLMTLVTIRRAAEEAGIPVADEQLPQGARQLLHLASIVKEPEGARRREVQHGLVDQVGNASLRIWAELLELVRFIGVCVQSVSRLVRGRATYQRSDFLRRSRKQVSSHCRSSA